MAAVAPTRNRYDLLSDTHVEFEGDTPYAWPADRAGARLILAGDIGSIGGGTWERFLRTPEVLEYDKVFVVFGNHEFYSVANPEGGGKQNPGSGRRAVVAKGAGGAGAGPGTGSAGGAVGSTPELVPPAAATAGVASAAAAGSSGRSAQAAGASTAPRRSKFPMDDLRKQAATQLATIPGATGKVFILDRGVYMDGHVAILGATLWTDVLRVGREHVRTLRHGIRDFDECLVSRGEPFMLDDMGAAHALDAEWLQATKDAVRGGVVHRVLVITHHPPVPEMIHEDSSLDSPAAAAEVSLRPDLGEGVDVWVSGHTHVRRQVVVGSCTYMSNAVGYPSERHAMGDPPAAPLRFEL